MKKFEGILLVTDLDGTLFCGGNVSHENCEAIRYFQSEGGLFAVASGRAPSWLPKWRDRFVPNTWSAAFNGAILCDAAGKEFVFEHVSDPSIVSTAMDILHACPCAEQICFCGNSDEFYNVNQGDALDRSRLPKKIYKCLLRVPNDKSDEYAEFVKAQLGSRYLVMRSWIRGIEFQDKGTGKGDALLRIRSLLGDRAKLTVGVGNYENDMDLIEAADIGYAVGDAIPSVKAIADRVTVNCADHAIAQIVSELERELL